MSKTITYDPAEDEPTDYKAATMECGEKIDRMLAEIKEKQANTKRMREMTQEILDRLKAA